MANTISYGPATTAAINVSDFKRAVDWYREKLGFEPEYLMEEMGWGELKTNTPGLTIGLGSMGQPGGSGGATLTFAVTDIDAARASLEGQGVRFEGPTDEIPGMVKLATFYDLDGNRLMFAQTLMQQ